MYDEHSNISSYCYSLQTSSFGSAVHEHFQQYLTTLCRRTYTTDVQYSAPPNEYLCTVIKTIPRSKEFYRARPPPPLFSEIPGSATLIIPDFIILFPFRPLICRFIMRAFTSQAKRLVFDSQQK